MPCFGVSAKNKQCQRTNGNNITFHIFQCALSIASLFYTLIVIRLRSPPQGETSQSVVIYIGMAYAHNNKGIQSPLHKPFYLTRMFLRLFIVVDAYEKQFSEDSSVKR